MSVVVAAERFPASGGFAGEGVRRLMGAPNLSALATVIRESLQNSCDAAGNGEAIRVMIRFRRLEGEALIALREFFHQLPEDSPSLESMEKVLSRSAPLVMEISDFGTAGLGGPTRADEAPPDGVKPDFVNFVRNVGAKRDTHQGGGTYGYGKTALYLASSCGVILVDSLASAPTGEQRRLIGCHIGDAYVHAGGRCTGRHWWGVATEQQEFVEPLTDAAATDLADRLGLPRRSEGETGTTITILDPQFGDEADELDSDDALGEIEEIILWYFWPKMIDLGAGQAMSVTLCGSEGERPVRNPDEVAPLDLFADAFRKIRSGASDVRAIRSIRPPKLLGRLAIRRGFRSPRIRFSSAADAYIPHTSRHIAVMRPAELVVRYYEGASLPDEKQEWAGVFICDDDRVVERAFSDAEPPAHDDWVPENLPKGPAKTYVNVAIREITNVAAAAGGLARPVSGVGGDGPSLARASISLARMLPAGVGPEDRGGRGGGGGGGGRAAGRVRIDAPTFIGLQVGAEGVEALFEIKAVNRTDSPAMLVVRPGLVMDGVLTDETAAPRGEVRVLGWNVVDGTAWEGADGPRIDAGDELRCRVRVAVPAGVVVGIAAGVGDVA
jgi:hypothetical protein